MKTTLRLIHTILLLSISSLLFAQHVNKNRAIDVAKNHLSMVAGNSLKSGKLKEAKAQILSFLSSDSKKDTLIFIVNDTINNNWVIIAADERVWPIIAYSLNGRYNENNQAPAFIEWLENQKKEIEFIRQNNIHSNSRISQQWANLSSSSLKSAQVITEVLPLLKTTWNQGCYYNVLCPSDANGQCGHVWTGCVATSMAQIMKYWNYPTNGNGSYSYLHSTYGNLSANFGSTTYQWAQMPNNVTSQNDAVATLMFHCGVSVNMDYSPVTSGADEPRDPLVGAFKYSPNAQYVNKSAYSESDWTNLLKSELDSKRPIYYSGNSTNSGHAWVCDGYQNSDYFHFNWGWGGSQDGYYYLGNMNYNIDQGAIIKIFPSSLPDGYNGFFLSENSLTIGSNGSNTSINISSSANWIATSNQSWLSLNPGSGGSGTSKLVFTATDNNTESTRSAIVTVSVNGFNNQLITVTQPPTVKVTITPGGLRDALANKLTTTTNLTITGIIDARDFKTIRDEMPLLSELDLSDTQIVEYIGTGGTGLTMSSSQTYPANTIPFDAFFNNNTFVGKTSLTTITLPKSITAIGFYAFGGCYGLMSITIPNTVTTIGWCSFFDCKGMTSIYIPASVSSIENGAFSANSGLITVASDNPNYSSNEGVLFDKNQYKLINCPISKSGNYSIPSTVKSIENSAFQTCNKLTSITIPTSVISIGESAFYYCHGLSSITIPSSVTTIGERAFWYNSALINVDEGNLFFSSFDGALFNKDKTKLIQCSWAKSSFTIPSSVTEIGAHSFENCTKLISVTVPSSVKTIGDYAFWSTCNLSNVYIPPTVTSIGEFAFNALGTYSKGIVNVDKDNPNYMSVEGILFDKSQKILIMCPDFKTGAYTIPSTVNTIANRAFFSCYALTSISIPSSVNAIGYLAFADCDGLQSIITQSKTPVVLSSDSNTGSYQVFNGVNKSTCILNVPCYTKALYSKAYQWKEFANIVEATEGFLPEKNAASLNAKEGSNTTIGLKANVKWTASSNQSWLTVSPASGSGNDILKFTAVTSNTSTSARTAVVTITAEDFEPEEIIITQGARVEVTAGGLHDALASILNSITCLEISGTIDARDFKTMRDEMPMLSQIDLSDATIVAYTGSLGTNFDGTNISYPANTIPEYAFVNSKWEGKPNLTSITLPLGLETIGVHSFDYSGLASIVIPASVKTIGAYAFYECTSLASIQVMSPIPINLSSSPIVFYKVDKTTCKLSVPFGSISLYSAADQWKDFTNVVEMPGLFLSATKLGLPKTDSTLNVVIGSSVQWIAESNQSWMTIDATSGATGIKTIILMATANNTNSPRYAVITISASGLASQTISITQYGNTEVTAGNLHTVLGDQLATTTSLTLSGTIDARDFKTMRDEMTSLTDIDLSAATIVAYSGTEGTSNSYYSYYSNVIPDYSFFNPATLKAKTNLISMDLPLNTNSIGYQSFTNCKSLSSISIPSSVSSIASYAFNGCTSLNSVSLSSSVYSIGSFAFVGCKASINVNEGNLYYSSLDGVLFNKTKTTILQCPTSKSGDYTIPSTVTTIGMYSFYLCRNLTSVKIPSVVNSIGNFAFSNCNAFHEIIIPTSVLSIGSYAFQDCTNLSSIKVFWLTPLNLNSVISVFDAINKITCALYVPYGSKTSYQSANQWKDFTNIIEIPGFMLSSTAANLAYNEGSTSTVDVISYTNWTAHSDQSWLSVNPGSFTGNSSLIFSAAINQTASIRIATVTISANGVNSQTIMITQEANPSAIKSIQITLNTGWNIISANVVPTNLNLKDIFQPLIDAGKLKKVMDEAGKTLENLGAFGGWKNNIGSLNSTKGYKVNVTATSTLSLEGAQVQLPFDIALNTGWNIISYPSTSIQDAKAVVQSLIDAGKLKKVMDEAGKTIENLGAFGGWKNSIGNFMPGKGYKVNVTASCTLTIPASGNKSAVVIPELLASEHFKPVFAGNGTDHMNIHLVNLQKIGTQVGDEIGIFDGKLCVGSATIGAEHMMDGSISIPASANDELTKSVNGFNQGHSVELRLFRGIQTYMLSIEKLSGPELFEKNGSLLAQGNLNDLTGLQVNKNTAQFKCYPNPFAQEITIEVQNPKLTKITVEIYNMAGQRIKNLYKGADNRIVILKWNGTNDSGQKVAPGAYLCKVNELSKQLIFEGAKGNK